MLHMDSAKRLSIDIDIICPPGTNIEEFLRRHAQEYGFGDVRLVERVTAHNIPVTHAKFFYQVTYVTHAEMECILLDVLFEDTHYHDIEQLPIQSRFLKLEGEPVMVNVPSKADMLGDKLTAFAPNTTGIPYFKGEKDCSMEIIKQLVDIAHGEKYTIDSAITNASKAAYLSRLIANGVPTAVHFNPQNIDSLRDAVIKDPLHTKLNKLRKSNIEAFFYWNEIGKIHNTKM